jgi:hypothetical protein
MEEHNIPDEVFRKSNEGTIVLLFQQNLQKGITKNRDYFVNGKCRRQLIKSIRKYICGNGISGSIVIFIT